MQDKDPKNEKHAFFTETAWLSVAIQFIKFGLVGVANTLISLVIYYVCIWLGVHYILANTLGFFAGTLNAFFWNNRYVFKDHHNTGWVAFIRLVVAYGATWLLSSGLLVLWVQVLSLSEWVAPLINLCITVPLNFLLNRYWVFRKTKAEHDE